MGNSQCKAVCIQDKSGASFNNVKKMKKITQQGSSYIKRTHEPTERAPIYKCKRFQQREKCNCIA